MPSSEIQMHLIDLFFKTRYQIMPVIPKRTFYEQLQVKGPLVTPLLLNAMYCSVSAFSTLPNTPKASVFFNRAKSLLDDFLDTPRVSTVAALYLLSIYEPTPTKTKSMTDQHCRSWIYSGMGFRMCLELGLNMDTPHSRGDMSIGDIELRRRLFWACYCLDKLQSFERERLWALPSSLAKTALPKSLPGDDETEQSIVMAFQQKVKLAIIGEEGLQIRASFAMHDDDGDDDLSRKQFNDQLRQYRLKLIQWRNDLPHDLGKFKQYNTVNDVMNEPKHSPLLTHLQIIYYFMLSDALFRLPFDTSISLEHRIYAAQLTRCVEHICEYPSVVERYEFLAYALISAIRVHARYLNHPDPEVEYQSLSFFNGSVSLLRKLKTFAIIPECTAILQHISAICQNFQNTFQPDKITSDSIFHGSRVPNYDSHNQFSASAYPQVIQSSQELYNDRMIDPYKTRDSTELSSSILTASSFDSLNIFSSSIGVDFDDRKQLWEFAVQEASQQQCEVLSTPTTPEESVHYPVATSSTTGWASPCSVEFNCPIDQTDSLSPSVSLNEPYGSCSSSPHQQVFIRPFVSYASINSQSSFVQPHIATQFQFSNQDPTIIPSHHQYNFSDIPHFQHVYYSS
jgi:hypothetical protein